MRLAKQFSLMIIVLFSLIFMGVFSIGLHNTRTYLGEQLAMHAQDTATSLGLSLSLYSANQDTATMMSMVDAIFDRGYYTEITLTNTEGDVLLKREQAVQVDKVPIWFMHLFPLPTPRQTAVLMSGWHQAGNISVVSNPAYAYSDLWRNTLGLLAWLLALTVFVILGATTAIRHLLKPLDAITKQAEAICRKEFPIEETLPKTAELRTVVTAMNNMVAKLKQVFAEQAHIADNLRRNAFEDSVTGLGNRHFFNDKMAYYLSAEQNVLSGYLLLLELSGLADVNQDKGFVKGDQLLKDIASAMKTLLISRECVIARISGSAFAVVILSPDKSEANVLVDTLFSQMSAVLDGDTDYEQVGAHGGLAYFEKNDNLTDLLALCDTALRNAQQKSPRSWMLASSEKQEVAGAMRWKQIIEDALEHKRCVLHAQQFKLKEPYYELFLRIQSDGEQLLSAGQFMAAAEKFGLATALDKQVIVESLVQLGQGDCVAINLSKQSLLSESFLEWLPEALADYASEFRHQVVFEISEYVATNALSQTKAFNQLCDKLGVGFALDQFGSGFAAFGYLHGLSLRYIKLDGTYTYNIQTDKEKQFFVRSVREIARTLDFDLIATNVESQQQVDTLKSLGVNHLQGLYLAKVKQWPNI